MSATAMGSDGQIRCQWCLSFQEYVDYHDHEWGFPVTDDRRLFEKLCLESFQSGLSWRTILTKRDNFRQAFHHFDFNVMAQFTEQDVQRLLQDSGIIRHRGKIEAVINNAHRVKELIKEEGSLAEFVWRFEPHQPEPLTISQSPESLALSRELKKRGWKFIGPTTVYSFMQAMGLVNDHALECIIRQKVQRSKANFQRPV